MSSLHDVAEEAARRYPAIAGGLITRWESPGSPRWAAAERALGYIERLPHISGDFSAAIDSFAHTSIEFLRLQARFLKTGHYACSSSAELVDTLYGDAEEMEGHYLDGLAMTYALWPNHSAMLAYFEQEFLARIPPGSRAIEIGPGHGLLGWAMLDRVPDLHYTALDISAPALQFVERAYSALGFEAPRTAFVEGDVTSTDAADRLPDADVAVCCEVLEHVDDPKRILEAIARVIAPGGLAFVSTVANLEAIDHVYLFTGTEHIRDFIRDAGFEIVDDQPLVVPGSDAWGVESVNYSAILRSPS